MSDIFDYTDGSKHDPPVVLRAGENGEWQPSPGADGFLEKPFFSDETTQTSVMLMQIEPGADAPAHSHEGREHLYVVNGSFSDGYGTYGPGDFIVRNPKASHNTSSEDGATVLVVMTAP